MNKRKQKNQRKQTRKISKSSNLKKQTLSKPPVSKKKVIPSSSKDKKVILRKENKYRKRRFFFSSFLCAIIIIFAMVIWKCSLFEKQFKDTKNDKIEQKQELHSELSLVMVGDVLIHSAVYGDAAVGNGYDFKPMLENVKPFISKFDLAYCNQETILGGSEIGLSSYPSFNSPYEVGDALVDSGFNLVSLSTNHTLDRGEKAILNSRNYWNKHANKVLTTGSYSSFDERNKIDIRKKNNISYTMLSYTDLTNGQRIPSGKDYLLNLYDEEVVKKDVERVRSLADVVIVSLHFGEEYTHTPTSRQKQIAKFLASLGVDIVIGTHPHVIQPIEFIDKTMVVYSLGNFISAQRGTEKLTGLMASVTIKKVEKDGKVTISLDNADANLVYTSSLMKNGYRKNFKLYPYSDLNDKILPNYKKEEEKYLNIVTSYGLQIEKR